MGRGEDRYRHHHHHQSDRYRHQDRSGSQGRTHIRRPTTESHRYSHGSSSQRRQVSPNRAQIYPTSQVSPFVLPSVSMPMGPAVFEQYPQFQIPSFNQMQSNPSPFIQDFSPQSKTGSIAAPICNQNDYTVQTSLSEVATSDSSTTSSQQSTQPKISLERLNLPSEKITKTGIIPDLPYYELPAALMVPLIPASQTEYKTLKPSDLRLPFPKFPDEKFLQTIDQYYKKDDKTRDDDGWDREFIDTFIKQKKTMSETS